MQKTIRFGDLVRASGRPQTITLWTAPEKNKSFSKAVRENKVLTIHPDPGGHRKEYGQIGLHQQHGAIYMVFPKPLPKENSRIVGINYQLAVEPTPKDTLRMDLAAKSVRKKNERPKPVSKPAKPELKTFQVLVRRTATIEETELVKAESEKDAREAATKVSKTKRFPLNRSILKVEILEVSEGTIPSKTARE